MKELLKWMAAGLAGILMAGFQVVSSGGPVNIKAVGSAVLAAVLYRVGSFLVGQFGPKPAA